ncbi:hypothetical protein [Algoriphagus winogradskyi]|uniref:PH domain-containing protein n=1 Tax=Algoriphagus winogradskyi TaxID=237017 RepID=A0ABY1PGG9_9BACT|nr:hypothetical protein [Algoriphagus winogradskyi]SMP31563.1 hypothetical protein SAMN06265367_107149 [Algoriphagus winogradskyi]
MEQLKSETQVSHLKSGDFDTWREAYCIGLDQKNGQLLFLNSLEKGNQVQKIDLRQVRLCRPIRNFREMKVGKEKRQIIQKVSLKLDHYDEQSKPVTIEIYDEERSDYMINEWDLAQAWSQKINNLKN